MVNAVQCGETAQEPEDERRQHKHDALQEDHVNQTCFAQALHSHDTKLKGFGFYADHQEGVNQQNTQDDEQKNDYIEDQTQKQDGLGEDLHCFEDVERYPDWVEAKSIDDFVCLACYALLNVEVVGALIVVYSWMW